MSNGYRPFWILGTDTNVGKTIVSAWLTAGLRATYWKPIQSGTIESCDTQTVRDLSQLPGNHFLSEVYTFKAPLSPHVASRLENVTIRTEDIKLPDVSDISTKYLIMEGAGGVLVPLNDYELLIDLVAQMGSPVVLVCRSALGTINHTLLTIRALQSLNVPILGFIMNGQPNPENEQAIVHFGGIPCLGRLPQLESLETSELMRYWDPGIEQHLEQRIQML